jgi:hypothetical protein
MVKALGLVGKDVGDTGVSAGYGTGSDWPATAVAISRIIEMDNPTNFIASSGTVHSLSYSN